MNICTHIQGREPELIAVFVDTFTDAEGAAEGQRIGQLVEDLLLKTQAKDGLQVVYAEDERGLLGCIVFTRLHFALGQHAQDEGVIYLLSPVAVRTAFQGQKIGQKLIEAGLNHIRDQGAELVVTYGDPAYYQRCGFHPADLGQIPAPYALQYPHGWQVWGWDSTMTALQAPVTCAVPFCDPGLW